jgi:two-component system, OmpR family, sensor histidine kinase KdpD
VEGDEFYTLAGAMARLAAAAGAVALLTVILRRTVPQWQLAHLVMFYLLGVQVVAVLGGRVPAILAAVLSFLAVNYFFIHPVGHWTVSDPSEWLALLMFLATAVLTGQLAATLRKQVHEAQDREREMRTLHALSTATAGQIELESILVFLTDEIKKQFGGASCEFLLRSREDPRPPPRLSNWTSSASGLEFPVRSGHGEVGQMRVGRRMDGWPHSTADRRLLQAFAHHAAMAIERARLAGEAQDTRLLRDSDALKSRLLSAVSHDLRTPLAGIKALTTALLQENVDLSSEVVREALLGIDEETDRMTRLVSDLLDLSRIEAGALRPAREPLLVPDLIDDTVHRLSSCLSGRAITLEVEEGLPVVNLDYVQMQQVLTNLLENAARYSPGGTPLTLGAEANSGGLELWVTDHGPGVPREERERIFDRFYRLEHHETEQHGTGMGLAISRGLVEAHGGRLWVEETPGGGATFRMRIPLGEGDMPASPFPPTDFAPGSRAPAGNRHGVEQ